ncbi:hypothetical protein ABZ650_13340, partial [Streptomyces griseoviridis]
MSATGRSALVRAALVGAATGLRSQWGAAAVAWSSPPDARAGPAGRDAVRAGPWLRGATATAALAEFVADKSPRAPSRLAPAGLGPRDAGAEGTVTVRAGTVRFEAVQDGGSGGALVL